MIGLDTSHCISLAKFLNRKKSKNKIKYAFRGGNQDFSKSRDRVDKFTEELNKKYDIAILDSIEEVAEKSDAILLTSVDGRQHLEQFQILSKFKKPVWIDKPFTCSLEDAKKIMEISKKSDTPFFSSSILRFTKGIAEYKALQDATTVEITGPVPILEDYPGYFWYGIHSIEILYEIMQKGFESISLRRFPNQKYEIIVAKRNDGRIGIIYGCRYSGFKEWTARIFTNNRLIITKSQSKPSGMELMIPHILNFFETKKSPIEVEEMIEIISFIESINNALKEPKAENEFIEYKLKK